MTMMISRGKFQGTNEELRASIEARVSAFRKALAVHAKTTGVPAPREDALIEELARTGAPFEIETAPEQPKPPTAEELAAAELAEKRAAALRALDERRLAAAVAEPDAPQEVKDYAAASRTIGQT